MNSEQIIRELNFNAMRSSGPGGQHVNKTASKVEVSFNPKDSEGLSEREKTRVQDKLAKRITQDGNIVLQCGETRSQHRNKAIVIERLLHIIKQSLTVAKKRKKTKPSRSAIEKRIKAKKKNALKKSNRKPPKID